MKEPETPFNERERLAALEELGVLHTPAEERFDRITRLAQRLFDIPIALITLVNHDSQWFKSCQGLTVLETSREVSFCGHALLEDKVFVIEDTHHSDVFIDNPLVTSDPSIRFYAGQPISFQGHRLGTLCVIDRVPRTFSASQLDSLKSLAGWVETELLMWRNSRNSFLLDILERSDRKKLIDPVTGDLNEQGLALVQSSVFTEKSTNRPTQIKVSITNLFDKEVSKNIREWIRKEFALAIRVDLSERAIMGTTDNGSFIVFIPSDSEIDAQVFMSALTSKLASIAARLSTSDFSPEFEVDYLN